MRSNPSVLSGLYAGLLIASTVNLTSADVNGVAVVPRHAGPQLPGDVHAAVAAQPDAAVLERRHLAREQRHHAHLLVGRRQPFDDAGLDVFEDVGAEAVERVGLAVVADDQQIVRWRRGGGPTRRSCRAAAARPRAATPRRARRSHHRPDLCNERHRNRAERQHAVVEALQRERGAVARSRSRRRAMQPVGAEPVHERRRRETSSSCTPPPRGLLRTCRRGRDRRATASSKRQRARRAGRCRRRRGPAAGRACAAGRATRRRQEADLVHQVGRIARPAFGHRAAEKHADAAGAVDGRDAADRRRAGVRVVVLHVVADRAVVNDVIQLDDAACWSARSRRALLLSRHVARRPA